MADSHTSDLLDLDPLTDAELSALALAADPDTTVDSDAQCFWDVTEASATSPLPEWYMPAPMPGLCRWTGWRRQLVRCNIGLIIASFLTINAYGLCNTYGQLHL